MSLSCLAVILTAGVILKEEKMPSVVGERQFWRYYRRHWARVIASQKLSRDSGESIFAARHQGVSQGPLGLAEKNGEIFTSALLQGRCSIRENQTCTELRSTISRHLLPPVSRWRKTVDSYKRFCRNSRISQRNRAFSGTGKRQIPLREKGGTGDTKR